jgi:hypothetical protein
MKFQPLTDLIRRSRAPALPRSVRWAVRLVVGLPLLALLVAAFGYFKTLGHLLRANLAPIAAGEVGRQIGHEVRLGGVEFASGLLTLDRVAVADQGTFAGSGTGLTAPRIAIHYRLHDLLFDSGNAAHAIGDIEIDHPNVLVERYTQKTFNFTNIIDVFTKKPSRPNAKPFAGRIIVRDGVAHARDFVAPANLGLRPAVNTLTKVFATVDFHSPNNVYFTGTAYGVEGRVTAVALSGDASRKTAGRFRVQVKVADGDAAYWSSYFAQASSVLKKATVVSGRASLDMTASRLGSRPPPGLPVDLEGRVTVRGATVALHDPRFLHLPLTEVNGFATFTGSGMSIAGNLRGGGQPVRVDGSVFDFTNPQLAFTASSPHIDAVRLAHYFPQITMPHGIGIASAPVTARITGSSLNPVVQIDTTIPAVTYAGNTATDVHTQVLYANSVFLFPNATFRLKGGGQGAVRVTINSVPKTPTVRIGGHVTGVNLAALRLPPGTIARPLALGGLADVAFLADDEGQPLSVTANVSVDRPRVDKTTLRAARGRLVFSATRGLTLSQGLLQAEGGGIATASGTIPLSAKSALNLSVSAAGADMARLLSPYAKVPVSGLAYAQAHVGGPLSAPQIAGQVQLYGPRIGRLNADLVTGSISGGMDAVRLKDVVIRRYPTSVRLAGTVSDLKSTNPLLELDASLSRGYLSSIVSLATDLAPPPGKGSSSVLEKLPELTGLVSATAHVTGRLKSPQVAAHADFSNALIDAYSVKKAGVDVAYDGQTIRVANLSVQAEDGATATGRGQFTPQTGRIDAVATGSAIDLEEFGFLTKPYADVAGVVDVPEARIGGTLRSPSAEATVSARSVSVEGQSFAPFTLGARFANGVLSKTGAPWVFTLLTPEAEGAQYIVDTLRLTVPTPAHPTAPQALTLAAEVPAGKPENLRHLVAALRGSRFQKTPAVHSLLAQLDALPTALEGYVWVPSLTVDGPLLVPSIHATLSARDLSVADSKIGHLDSHLAYSSGADPTAHADISTTGLSAEGVPLDSLSAEGGYADHVVTVSRLDAHGQEAYLHGSGRADLHEQGSVDASLDASDVPLALFNTFLPLSKRLSGQIGALTVVASGKTQAATLTASVDLDQPAVTVTTPATVDKQEIVTRYGIDSIRSSKITLTTPLSGGGGRVLAVSDLSAFKGGRRIATLSGTLPISLPAFLGGPADDGDAAAAELLPGIPGDEPLHADLQVADLSILTLFAPDLIDPKRTGGALSASIDYGGGAAGQAPHLSGQVSVVNGSLGVMPLDTSIVNLNGHITAQNILVSVSDQVPALEGGQIAVQSFTAASSKGGTLSLTGGGTLGQTDKEGVADLHLTAKDLRVDETGRGNFLAKTYNSSARGRVNGQINITGPWLTPLVATPPDAPILITDAVGTLPNGTSTDTGPKTAPLIDPSFHVKVLLGSPGRTVSVRGPLLQAEANGDLELTGTLPAPVAKAHVTVARGQFILPPTRLVIVKPDDGTVNTVDVRYPVPSSDPADDGAPVAEVRVHLVARANVSVSPATLAANQSVVGNTIGQATTVSSNSVFDQTFGASSNRYTITANINGLLNSTDPNEPQIKLTSNPYLSQQQILASLVPEGALQGILGGGQGAETALKQGMAEALSAVAVPTLLSPIEQSVAGVLGLEDFSVDYSPDAPVDVTLSKQIAPRLIVTYIRALGPREPGAGVTSLPQYTVKLGYGLTRHLQVSLSTDDQRNNTLALESIFAF